MIQSKFVERDLSPKKHKLFREKFIKVMRGKKTLFKPTRISINNGSLIKIVVFLEVNLKYQL